MNDTLKNIAERYSCRDFSAQTPDDAALEAIAQAAIQAPSGMNRQYWHVIVIKNKALIDEMDEEGMKYLSLNDKTTHERMLSRGGRLFYNAPCMFLLVVKVAEHPGAELMDCGILAQNVVLAATSLGLATLHCGFTGVAFAGEKGAHFKERLKFPAGYECGIGVLVGYANTIRTPHEPDQGKITIIN
jgi:nitroreductase